MPGERFIQLWMSWFCIRALRILGTLSIWERWEPPQELVPSNSEVTPQGPEFRMATSELTTLLSQLQSHNLSNPEEVSSLLTKAKRQLLELNALLPSSTTSPQLLSLARQTLETGALLSIRMREPDAFTRYYQQLLPFYELPTSSFEGNSSGQRSKVTGLYLLLLLTKGDYAGFHTVLEGLEVENEGKGGLQGDGYIQYPIKLEQWLMEGSYDRVWGATKREGVPSEEFGVFSEVSLVYLATTPAHGPLVASARPTSELTLIRCVNRSLSAR